MGALDRIKAGAEIDAPGRLDLPHPKHADSRLSVDEALALLDQLDDFFGPAIARRAVVLRQTERLEQHPVEVQRSLDVGDSQVDVLDSAPGHAAPPSIPYQNTCDQRQIWTTSHCDDQATPRLVVQNLTFADGDSTPATYDGGGGGAIFARGGRLKIVRSKFVGNRCDATGPDLGGGAVRALSQHADQPVTVVRSTFSHGVCSNGAALGSIGVSWSIYNSVFTDNRAIGRGANPARPRTPGGGSGGALYADGNDFRVLIAGTKMTHNHAREGGGAIFFVSNDRSGVLKIRSSALQDNPSDGFETDPGIYFLGRDQIVVDSVVK